jgi:hypothetical protein
MGSMKDELGDMFFENRSRAPRFTEAQAARDEGMSRVAKNSGDWMSKALDAVKALPAGFEGTGEDIRLKIEPRCGKPHHHNATGALIRTAINRGMLRYVAHRQMKTEKSHARSTPVYVRI